jgi:hypothetical protein
MRIRSVGAELFHADGRTNTRRQLTVALRSSAQAPNNRPAHRRYISSPYMYARLATAPRLWILQTTQNIPILHTTHDDGHLLRNGRYLASLLITFTCFFFLILTPCIYSLSVLQTGTLGLITATHTHKAGTLWTRDQPVADTTHNIYKKQTAMPPVGFEPATSAHERPLTHALDRAAIRTGRTRKWWQLMREKEGGGGGVILGATECWRNTVPVQDMSWAYRFEFQCQEHRDSLAYANEDWRGQHWAAKHQHCLAAALCICS